MGHAVPDVPPAAHEDGHGVVARVTERRRQVHGPGGVVTGADGSGRHHARMVRKEGEGVHCPPLGEVNEAVLFKDSQEGIHVRGLDSADPRDTEVRQIGLPSVRIVLKHHW